jgi:hypothetical protein
MTHWQLVSALFALLGPVAILAYDLIALYFGGPTATISYVVRVWSHNFHELPYMSAGFLLWLHLHLFGYPHPLPPAHQPIVAASADPRSKPKAWQQAPLSA